MNNPPVLLQTEENSVNPGDGGQETRFEAEPILEKMMNGLIEEIKAIKS